MLVCVAGSVVWVTGARVEHVGRDIVSAFAIYRVPIDFNGEFVLFLVKLNSPNPIKNILVVDHSIVFVHEFYLKLIQILLSDAIRPP